MYKLQTNILNQNFIIRLEDEAIIPYVPANADYQAFKLAFETGKNADGTPVELKDADGNTMTAEQVAAFLETLP